MDLSQSYLLQQLNARPISGQDLEVLGKKASVDWQNGRYNTLTQAVVETVKEARLSPEQVHRVIEFANTSAYLDEFNKEGASHKVIEFAGGPAHPSDVLNDLNDGGGGTVFDRGTLDYQQPPSSTKTASVRDEATLASAFGDSGRSYPEVNPYRPVLELREKLASLYENTAAEISGLEVMYSDLKDRLYAEVKQAAMDGVSLGEIADAWQSIAPSADHIKVAFQLVAPRLLKEGVFPSARHMERSAEKTAGVAIPNSEHPLMHVFDDFCSTISTLAEKRAEQMDVRENLGKLELFVKRANVLGDAWSKVKGHADEAAKYVTPYATELGGETFGKVTGKAIKYSPHLVAGVGGMEGYRYLSKSPDTPARVIRSAAGTIGGAIPGTPWAAQRDAEVAYGQ